MKFHCFTYAYALKNPPQNAPYICFNYYNFFKMLIDLYVPNSKLQP